MLSKPKLRSKHQQHDFRDLAMHFWHTVAISDLESRSECAHRAYLNPEEPGTAGHALYFEKPEVERMSEWPTELDNGLVYNKLTAPSRLPTTPMPPNHSPTLTRRHSSLSHRQRLIDMVYLRRHLNQFFADRCQQQLIDRCRQASVHAGRMTSEKLVQASR